MRKLVIRPQARIDLLEIWHYIARDSVTAANKVADKLGQAICGLVEMPGKGHRRADVKSPQYRFWSVYSYLIAYRYDQQALTIVRVIHGRRDFRKLFNRAR